jgi:hypothetical protein
LRLGLKKNGRKAELRKLKRIDDENIELKVAEEEGDVEVEEDVTVKDEEEEDDETGVVDVTLRCSDDNSDVESSEYEESLTSLKRKRIVCQFKIV